MQALILAAGMGTRLSQYTEKVPKCMVPVNGIPMLENSIDAIVASGIKKLIIGLGYKGDVLKDFVKKNFSEKRLNGMKIEFVDNPVYDTTNNIYSLYLTKDLFCQDDTILLESDLIYDKKIIEQLVNSPDPNLAVVSHFEPWMDGTCTVLDENNNITKIIDKVHFKYSELDSYYKTVNIYKFSKDFINNSYLPFLEAYQNVYGKNEYYETSLEILTLFNPKILKGLPVSGDVWYEIDDPADLNIADNRFATPKKKLEMMNNRNGGSWRFPSLVDFSGTANAFFPTSKFMTELTTSFSDYALKNPSSQNQQNILSAKLMKVLPEHIAVSNGIDELTKTVVNFLDKETVFISTNSNKTGKLKSEEKVLEKILSYSKNQLIVLDETYSIFANDDYPSFMTEKFIENHPNVIVVKNIADIYGVPGLNLSFAVASTDITKKINEKLPNKNVNSVAEYFMQILEKYKKDYNSSFKKVAEARNSFINELSLFGKVEKSESSFIIFAPESKTSEKTAEILLDKYNILVKVTENKTLRVNVRSADENMMLIKALKEIL